MHRAWINVQRRVVFDQEAWSGLFLTTALFTSHICLLWVAFEQARQCPGVRMLFLLKEAHVLPLSRRQRLLDGSNPEAESSAASCWTAALQLFLPLL